jgi:hypothetical protein
MGRAVGLVTVLATEAIPRAVGAGVTLVDDRGGKTTSGASDPVVGEGRQHAVRAGRGPVPAAWAQRALVRLDEIGSDGRWPRWSHAVEPLGLRAAMSAPLVPVAGRWALSRFTRSGRLPSTGTPSICW